MRTNSFVGCQRAFNKNLAKGEERTVQQADSPPTISQLEINGVQHDLLPRQTIEVHENLRQNFAVLDTLYCTALCFVSVRQREREMKEVAIYARVSALKVRPPVARTPESLQIDTYVYAHWKAGVTVRVVEAKFTRANEARSWFVYRVDLKFPCLSLSIYLNTQLETTFSSLHLVVGTDLLMKMLFTANKRSKFDYFYLK